MSKKIYDTVIIGGGPAGLTAALYAARGGLSVLLLERLSAGGQMAEAVQIDNYPGFENGINGFDLAEKMKAGAVRFGCEFREGEVSGAELSGEIKKIYADGCEISARTVIIAAGAEHKKLGLPDEERLIGKGVSYCASCDGAFYRGKDVAVIGGGNSAVSDALLLSKFCRRVHLIHRRDTLRAEKIYESALEKAGNIELHFNRRLTAISGADRVSGAVISPTDGGKSEEIPCCGIFISIGRAPLTEPFKNMTATDGSGYIIASETTETNIPGVFAAGDVRTKPLRQIVTAAADGATAAYLAQKYCSEQTKKDGD